MGLPIGKPIDVHLGDRGTYGLAHRQAHRRAFGVSCRALGLMVLLVRVLVWHDLCVYCVVPCFMAHGHDVAGGVDDCIL